MSYPTCPHCGYEFDEDETWFSGHSENEVHTGDCDESELTCPNMDCGEKFITTCVHVVTFESHPVEE